MTSQSSAANKSLCRSYTALQAWPEKARRVGVAIRPTNANINVNTRMWANAQPDGRPAEHRWRPLFNAAKFG